MQTYRQLVNAVLTLTLAAGVLTGCVTVVVPTATPEPSPTPVPIWFHGFTTGTSDARALEAGNYAVAWETQGDSCTTELDLVTAPGGTRVASLVARTQDIAPRPTLLPVTVTITDGRYAVRANWATCTWLVNLIPL